MQFASGHLGPLLSAKPGEARALPCAAGSTSGRIHFRRLSTARRNAFARGRSGGPRSCPDRPFLCYSTSRARDAITERIAARCEEFRDVSGLPDDEAAAAIEADGIDILVDLQGYTTNSRIEIVALRPAPIIVNWIGFPGTLGHPMLADYVIADRIVAPVGHEKYFGETLALMPHSYIPTDNRWRLSAPPSRADVGLPKSRIRLLQLQPDIQVQPIDLRSLVQIASVRTG